MRKRRAAAAVLFAALLTAALALMVVFLFKIREVRVENSVTSMYTGEQISAASGLTAGENIFAFRKTDVTERLLEALPYIGGVTVERRLPNTVVLKVFEATDYVGVPYRGGYLIVSGDMKILDDSFAAPADMPMVYGLVPTTFIAGSLLESENPGSVEALDELFDYLESYGWFDKVSAVNVRDKLNVSMVYENRVFVEFGSVAQLGYKFEMLDETVNAKLEEGFTGNINLSNPGHAYVTQGEMRFPEGFSDIGA